MTGNKLLRIMVIMTILLIPMVTAGFVFDLDFPFIHWEDGVSDEKIMGIEAYNYIDVGMVANKEKCVKMDWIDSESSVTHKTLGINVTCNLEKLEDFELLLTDTNFDPSQIKNPKLSKRSSSIIYEDEYIFTCRNEETLNFNGSGPTVNEVCTKKLNNSIPKTIYEWTEISAINENNEIGMKYSTSISEMGFYKYEFDTPIVLVPNKGFTTEGAVYLSMDTDGDNKAEVYADFQNSSFYNDTYQYKRNITVYAPSGEQYPVWSTATACGLDTTDLIDNSKMLQSGNDTLLVYDGTQIDYVWVNTTFLNVSNYGLDSTDSCIQFRVQANISAGGNDPNYEFYYGNSSNVLYDADYDDPEDVFIHYDSFDRANSASLDNAKYDYVETQGDWGIDNNRAKWFTNGVFYTNFSTNEISINKWKYYVNATASSGKELHVGLVDKGDTRSWANTWLMSMTETRTNTAYSRLPATGATTWETNAASMASGAYIDHEWIYDESIQYLNHYEENTRSVWNVQNNTPGAEGNFFNGIIVQGGGASANIAVQQMAFMDQYTPSTAHAFGVEESASNAVPSISNIVINTTSSFNYTNGTIQLSFDTVDSEGDPITESITWYKDDAEQVALADLETIFSGNTSKNNNWSALINASDATGSSTTWAKVVINNYPPSAPTNYIPNITTLTWQSTQDLSCGGSTDILDGDTINYEFWINLTGLDLKQNTTTTTYTHTFDQGNGTYTWNCRANDGDEVSNFITGNVSIEFNNSILVGSENKFTHPIIGGQNDDYALNVSFNGIRVDRTTAILNIFDTSYTPISVNTSGLNKTEFSKTVFIPIQSTNITESFYWNITAYYDNGTSEVFTYNFNQNVTSITLDTSCTVTDGNTYAVLNFTHRVETNDSVIPADIEGNLAVWVDGQSQNNNITTLFDVTNVNNTIICLNAPNNYTEYRSDGQVRYEADNHDPREYFLINHKLNNETDNIDLFSLDIDLASGISFTVEDQSGNPLPGRYIVIQRYDVGNNTYKTITIIKTDDDGKSYSYLRKFDVDYLFKVQNYTDVVFLSDNRKVITDSLTFTVASSTLSQFIDNFEAVSGVISFNNITNVFTGTVSGASGVNQVCLSVVKYAWNNDTAFIADTCTSDAVGTLSVDVSAYGNGTYIASLYTKENPEFTKAIMEVTIGVTHALQQFGKDMGKEGAVIAFFAFVIIITAAVATGSIVYVILLGLLMLTIMAILGFASLSLTALIGLIIIGGTIISLRRS